MDSSEQVKEFKRIFSSSRFQGVLLHYCGFTKLVNAEIQSFLSSYQVGKSSFEYILPILHCFFDAQQPSLCRLIKPRFIQKKQEILNAMYLTPADFIVARYFFTSLLTSSPEIQDIISFIQQKLSDPFSIVYADPVTINDAMKSLEVSVSMEITNIGTQGYSGVGKTSVLKLALGDELVVRRNRLCRSTRTPHDDKT